MEDVTRLASVTDDSLEWETCRDFVVPALREAGWRDENIREQFALRATRADRRSGFGDGFADYVLMSPNGEVPLAVVEAKRSRRSAADGLAQAIRYAEQLGVTLTYSTNGGSFIERNFTTGAERVVPRPASPIEAWAEYISARGLDAESAELLDQPSNRRIIDGERVRTLRWYQARAVHEALAAIARGEQRVLVLMATGTGKTFTAMQLIHKLREYERHVRPGSNYRVLYLADRTELLRSPHEKVFNPAFGHEPNLRVRGKVNLNREIYFATYQALLNGQDDEALLAYPSDFFDLVIVDECHRGSARENSLWRGVLDHFSSAVQVGMTATPSEADDAETYRYFGNPVFTYTLRQGIEDGYLAPYDVLRVLPSPDEEGWEPLRGEVDMHGNAIPEGVYSTRDFERRISLLARTRVVAEHLTRLLARHPGERAIVFCVDQDHAEQMRSALAALNQPLMQRTPEWVARITGDEWEKDRLLESFTSTEEPRTPIVVTTSRLLSTGVDVVDLRFVVLFRAVGSKTEFKQIVGRGTRLYPEAGKTHFTVVDYVGASRHFLDSDFDGYPPHIENVVIHRDGTTTRSEADGSAAPDAGCGDLPPVDHPDSDGWADADGAVDIDGASVGDPGAPFAVVPGPAQPPRPPKLVVDRASGISITGELRFRADTSGGGLQLVEFERYLRTTLGRVAGTADQLAAEWATPAGRARALAELERAGIRREDIAAPGTEMIDLFDALTHLAFDAPMPTRAGRARRARAAHESEIEALPTQARAAIEGLLERYVEHGVDDISTGEVLSLPPLSQVGSKREITQAFGGVTEFNAMLGTVQTWLYSA